MADGTGTAYTPFTKGQNNSNSVPFATKSVHGSGTGEDWQHHLTEVTLNSTGVILTRASTTGNLEFNVSVVEFNAASVKVQNGSLCAPTASGCTTSIGTSVNTSASALIFYSQIAGTIDDDYNSAAIRGNITNSTSLTFSRVDTTGTITGTWYIFESLDESFIVQNIDLTVPISAETATVTIDSVQTNKTFLIASYQATENSDNARDGSTRIELTDSTTITATRQGSAAGDSIDLTISVVTFTGDENVQRGTLVFTDAASAPENQINTINTVNLSVSTPWNPVLTGRMSSDGTGEGDIQGAFSTLELVNSTTIQGTRGLTGGATTASYEVIEWITPESDTSPPTVTLNSPVDNADLFSSGVSFKFTAIDGLGLKNATLYANFTGSWTANETNQTALTSGQPAFINATGISIGYYIWNIFVCDNAATPNCGFATANNTLNINSYGLLNVSISLPTDNTNVNQNETFTINVTVFCEGSNGANTKCGTVTALARYNTSGATPDTDINITQGDKPLYIIGGGGGGGVPTNMTQGDFNFSVGTEEANPNGLFFNGSHWFITGVSTSSVFIYFSNGTYTGNSWAIGAGCTGADGMTGNGSHLFISCGAQDSIEIRDFAGGGTDNFSTAAEMAEPFGVAINLTDDGAVSNFFISDFELEPGIFIYNADGTYSGTFINMSDIVINRTMDVEFDDDNKYFIFYNGIATGTTDTIKFVAFNGTLLLNFTYIEETGLGRAGLWLNTSDNSKIYIVDRDSDFVREWDISISGGGTNPKTSSETLEGGENFTVSWIVNATGLAAYEIDVLFNSTTYFQNITENDTEDRTVIIGAGADTDPPDITIDSPTNITFSTGDIDYNITLTEALHTAFFSVNGSANNTLDNDSNTHYFNISGNHVSLSEGANNITFWVNDSAGNANESTVFFTVDTTAPTVGNKFVNETTVNINQAIRLNVTATDNIQIDKVFTAITYPNGTIVNATMTNAGGSLFEINLSVGSTAGTLYYNITYSNDTAGNLGVNTSVLSVTVNAPTDTFPQWFDNSTNSTTAGTVIEHRVNWTDDTALSGFIFSFDNGTGTFSNDSFVEMSGIQNWSNVTKRVNTTVGATIQWRVYANDSVNQLNATDIFVYTTTDDTPPDITIDSPTNTSFATGDIDYNITLTEALHTAFFSVNGSANNTLDNDSNTHYFNISGNHVSLSEGANNITFWVNDTAGNANESTVFFTVDLTNPVSTFGTDPVDIANFTTSTVVFDFKASDNFNISYIRLYGNWTGWHANYTNTSYINDTYLNITVNDIPDGLYIWGVFSNDSAGNSDFTNTNRTFTVDTTVPTVTLNNPINNTKSSSSTVIFSAVCSDNLGTVDYCNLYGNWTTGWHQNQTNSSPISGAQTNFTVNDIPDGVYVWSYFANDSLGNLAFGVNRTLTVDTTAPTVGNKFVNETSVNINQAIRLNVTATDNIQLDKVFTEITYPNGTIVNATMTNAGGSAFEINLSVGGTTGTLYYNITYANDTSGNLASNTSILSVTVTSADTFPQWQDNSTNSTTAGTVIEHRVNWTDDAALSGYIFSFDNGTGTFSNDSFVEMSGIQNWSNVTKRVNTTVGATIQWRVYANDSINQLNATDIFVYATTEPTKNGLVSTTIGDIPFYTNESNPRNITLNKDQSQVVVFWVNATGAVNVIHEFFVFANKTSNTSISNITDIFNVTIKTGVANAAPTITNVEAIADTDPTDDSVVYITFNFTATDTDGGSNIDFNTAEARFQLAGETTRLNTTCINSTGHIGNDLNFTCTVGMWYFDKADTNWEINVTIKDNSGEGGENSSTTFQYNQLQAIKISPNSLSFDVEIGAVNQTATNDPTLINNTGNYNVTLGNININATDLAGEEISTDFIFAANFTVGIFTGATVECNATATSLVNGTNVSITGSILAPGNHSLNDNVTGQEQLYYCITGVPPDIASQTYSTSELGSWTIRILLVAIIPARRKKKKSKEKTKIIGDLSIPATIFSKNLGSLEAITKYMKENLKMNYHEIAELLNRDQRTIWTAYKKATEKQEEMIDVEKTLVFLPVSMLKDRKLTILESIVVYLKEQGMRYSEIAETLERDQRNIWTIYSKAIRKIKR